MDSNDSMAQKPERKHRNEKKRDRFFVLRNILNIVFMVGAIVGVIIYLNDRSTGTAIVLTAIVVKFTECVLRMMK